MIIRITLLILFFNTSFALANNLIEVNPDDTETVKVDKKNFACTRINQKIVIGVFVEDNLIRPYSSVVKKARKQFKKAAKSKAESKEKRFNKLKSINKKGRRKCKKALNGGGNSSPPANENNFDSNGDVTATGKALFEIPSNLSANVNEGLIVFQQNCTGCHMEQRSRSFTDYRETIKRSPMLYFEDDIPDEELADLVAYLNRFRFN